MASIKKYNGSSFENAAIRKYSTATDTITTLPADLYADGNNATVGLVGNMVQSGTPTPQNPIQPQECGDLETEGAKAGQYKIPISSANTTTPVYLGEVETTRKIKQLVLTGEENWVNNYSPTLFGVQEILNPNPFIPEVLAYCTQYVYNPIQSGIAANLVSGEFALQKYTTSYNLFIRNTAFTSTVDFKAYLAQQYANGTPVTIWYVLAEPTTGIVNEPLRKIGTYADTVSGISIPTITGADSFDVETTLKPPEVSLAYTGWHDASVKEWDGSQWQ